MGGGLRRAGGRRGSTGPGRDDAGGVLAVLLGLGGEGLLERGRRIGQLAPGGGAAGQS